jgi:circadian clock protein KaiC
MSRDLVDRPTGVPGLDAILGGGMLRRGMACIVGGPGTGKTVLAQQLAFAAASSGRGALYFSGLSEPHERLIEHLRTFRFFDESRLARSVQLLSLSPALEQDEDEAVDMVVQTARRTGATLVIVDGFGTMRRMLQNERETIRFLYRLSTQLGLLGAALVVTVEGDPHDMSLYPELAVSDILVGLYHERTRAGHRRYLEVLKRRGAAPLPGLHAVTIGLEGITCYPQLESSLPADGASFDPAARATFDLAELDAMLGGGLTRQTTTLLAGNQGTGKTLLGLQFLAAGAVRGEPGVFLGLRESVAQLRAKAQAHGIALAGAVEQGTIRLLAHPPVTLDPDILAWQVRDALAASGARRLVIDSVAEMEAAVAPARVHDYLAAIVTLLRASGVTAILTRETFGTFGETPTFVDEPAAVLTENVIFLRQVQTRGELRRVLAVVRMRFSDHDRTIREFTITEHGLTMLGRWASEASMQEALIGDAAARPTTVAREPAS